MVIKRRKRALRSLGDSRKSIGQKKKRRGKPKLRSTGTSTVVRGR